MRLRSLRVMRSIAGEASDGTRRLRPLRSAGLVRALFFAGLCASALHPAQAQVPDLPLVPMPYKITQPEPGLFTVQGPLAVALVGPADTMIAAGVARFVARWQVRTGEHPGPMVRDPATAQLVVACAALGGARPALGDLESYELRVSARQIHLTAPAPSGILRGLATLLQLVQVDGTWVRVPCCVMADRPRCAWRGLTIDVVHHWLPPRVLVRTLDAMELVKLNVLQLHLGDGDGLRLAIPNHPELTAGERPDELYTPEQVRRIVAAATARGIRVVPEMAAAQLVAGTSSASAPATGPDAEPRGSAGTAPPGAPLDPTDERTYALLEAVIAQTSTLFPDPYVSLGAETATAARWQAEPKYAAFIRKHALPADDGLYGYFVQRVAKMLTPHNRRLVEVTNSGTRLLPSGHGADGTDASTRSFARIAAVRLDADQSASALYAIDPLAESTGGTEALTGGDTRLGTEWVTPATIDTRLWPRAAAVAERLWTEPSPRWSHSLERRLEATALRLREMGVGWNRQLRFETAEVEPGSAEADAIRIVASAVAPVSDAQRRQLQPESSTRPPLTQLADWARPENVTARRFARNVRAWVDSGNTDLAPERQAILRQLQLWSAAARVVAALPADADPKFQDRVRVASLLEQLGAIGTETCAAMNRGGLDAARAEASYATINRAAVPTRAAVRFTLLPALRLLVAAASEDRAAHAGPPERWTEHLEDVVTAHTP